MTVITHGLEPVDYTLSPSGVMHLKSQHPAVFDTLCGLSTTGRGWKMQDETMQGTCATCLPCRSARAQTARNINLGNYEANEGLDYCTNCGCKYWENDTCVDCGAAWTPACVEE